MILDKITILIGMQLYSLHNLHNTIGRTLFTFNSVFLYSKQYSNQLLLRDVPTVSYWLRLPILNSRLISGRLL